MKCLLVPEEEKENEEKENEENENEENEGNENEENGNNSMCLEPWLQHHLPEVVQSWIDEIEGIEEVYE